MNALIERARSPQGRRLFRYSLVSVVAIIVSQTSILVLFGLLHWTAKSANVAATAIATIPSYALNRRWVWGKDGKSHLTKEVLPFWGLAFVGLAFSTWAADFAESAAHDLTAHRAVQTLIVMGANLGAYGVLWIGKFVIFEKVLFKHHHVDDAPA